MYLYNKTAQLKLHIYYQQCTTFKIALYEKTNKKQTKNNNKKIVGNHECSPNGLLSINVRTCNPSPLVHQDMTKKTTFYEKNI